MRTSTPSRSAERGQALPLLLLVLVLAAAAAVLVARVAEASAERLRAQTAADAAALAGAAAGPDAAERAADANGSSLERYASGRDGVVVEVEYRRARATAAAAGVAAPVPPGHPRAGLAPAMLAALDRADDLLGRSVTVVSGYRSRAEQEALWSRRHLSPYPVAPPGTSLHEAGLAIDVPASEVPALRAVARSAGLCQPLPWSDPVHFETCPPIQP